MASKRGYLSQTELAEFANITIVDATEADDQISQAEEMIDSYVGFQEKAVPIEYRGLASSGGQTFIELQWNQKNVIQKDYFKGCMVEIFGGTGIGERQICTGSTLAGIVTCTPFTATLDNTSFYKIFQVGKFPRKQDAWFDTMNVTYQWYKSIPEAVKRAVAAQVEFKITMGDSYFSSNKVNYRSENIGDYSYVKEGRSVGRLDDLIAPKAKMLLSGIASTIGTIIE